MADAHPDPELLRTLAAKWNAQADHLDTMRSKMQTAANGMTNWKGAARLSASMAINSVGARLDTMSAACRTWSEQLSKSAEELEKKLEEQRIHEIVAAIVGIFSVLLIPLSFGIGALVSALADAIVGVLGVAAGIAARLATLALELTIGVVIYGGLQIAIDMGAEAIAHKVVTGDARFQVSPWEALNVGVAAVLGGFFSVRTLRFWKEPPKADGGITNVPLPQAAPTPSSTTSVSESTRPATGGATTGTGHVGTVDVHQPGGSLARVPRGAGADDRIPVVNSAPDVAAPPATIASGRHNLDVGAGSPGMRGTSTTDHIGGDAVPLAVPPKSAPQVRSGSETANPPPARATVPDVTVNPGAADVRATPPDNGARFTGDSIHLDGGRTVTAANLDRVPTTTDATPPNPAAAKAAPPPTPRQAPITDAPNASQTPAGPGHATPPVGARPVGSHLDVGGTAAPPKAFAGPRPTEVTISPSDALQVARANPNVVRDLPTLPAHVLKPPAAAPGSHFPAMPGGKPPALGAEGSPVGGSAHAVPQAEPRVEPHTGQGKPPAGTGQGFERGAEGMTGRSPSVSGHAADVPPRVQSSGSVADTAGGRTPLQNMPHTPEAGVGRPSVSSGTGRPVETMPHTPEAGVGRPSVSSAVGRPVETMPHTPEAGVGRPSVSSAVGRPVDSPLHASDAGVARPPTSTTGGGRATDTPSVPAAGSRAGHLPGSGNGPEVRLPVSGDRPPASPAARPDTTVSSGPVSGDLAGRPHLAGDAGQTNAEALIGKRVAQGQGPRDVPSPGSDTPTGRPGTAQPKDDASSRTPDPVTGRDPAASHSSGDERSIGRVDVGRIPHDDLERAAATMADRHSELLGKVLKNDLPDGQSAARALRFENLKQNFKDVAPDFRMNLGHQIGSPEAFAQKASMQLRKFASHFAAEAGIAKDIGAIRGVIGEKYSTLVSGEVNKAVQDVAEDIARRAGMTADQAGKLTKDLAAANRETFSRAMDTFRSGIRDFRAGVTGAERLGAGDEAAYTLAQGKQSISEAGEARPLTDKQIDKQATDWAKTREKEFRGFKTEIGNMNVRPPSPRPTAPLERAGEAGTSDAVSTLNKALGDKFKNILTAEKLRPDAPADFAKQAQHTKNIVDMARLNGELRLQAYESLSPADVNRMRADFAKMADTEFDKVWRPVLEEGFGPKSDKFRATKVFWDARYRGMLEQVRVDGFVANEMRLLDDQLQTSVAAARASNVAQTDITSAIDDVRKAYRTEVDKLLRGPEYNGANLTYVRFIDDFQRAHLPKWDDLRFNMRYQLRENFAALEGRETGGAARAVVGDRGNLPGGDRGSAGTGHQADLTVTSGRVDPPGADLRPGQIDDLIKERDAALRDFRELDPDALSTVRPEILDRVATAYTRERLVGYDAIIRGDAAAVDTTVLDGLTDSVSAGASRSAEITRMVQNQGLRTTEVPSGLVVHSGQQQVAADAALVRAAARFESLSDGTRVFLGPGLRPEDLALVGTSRLSPSDIVVHAPLLSTAERLSITDNAGLTTALRTRPTASEAEGRVVPVDASGSATLPHLAAEWHVRPPGVAHGDTGLFDLTPTGASGVYRLSDDWVLETHTWGVWVRPEHVSAEEALTVRAGNLGYGETVVVGARGAEVPSSVVADVRDLIGRFPHDGGAPPPVHWVEGPPSVRADAPTSGRSATETGAGRSPVDELNERYANGLFDFVRTVNVIESRARVDLAQSVERANAHLMLDSLAEPAVASDLESISRFSQLIDDAPAAVLSAEGISWVEKAFKSDVDKLVETHLGRAEKGWYTYADVAGFEAGYRNATDGLSQRLIGRAHLDGRLAGLRDDIAVAFRHSPRLAEFPSGQNGFVQQAREAFEADFTNLVGKQIDALAGRTAADDVAATVATEVRELRSAINDRLDDVLQDAIQLDRALVEHGPGVGTDSPFWGEIRSTLEKQFQQKYGVGPGSGPGLRGAGHVDTPLWESGEIQKTISRVRQAYDGLHRADPQFDLDAVDAAGRLGLAHKAVLSLERATAARAEQLRTAGLTDDLTPAQISRFRDDFIMRVDAEMRTGAMNASSAELDDPGLRVAAATAKFESLTGDDLIVQLDRLARPEMVSRDGRMLLDELEDIADSQFVTTLNLDRVGDRVVRDLDKSYRKLVADDPDSVTEGWERIVSVMRADLGRRLEAEFDSTIRLSQAARSFHGLEEADAFGNASTLPRAQLDKLATSYRSDYLATVDRELSDAVDRRIWLSYERGADDSFTTVLDEARSASFAEDLSSRVAGDIRAAVDRLGLDEATAEEVHSLGAGMYRTFRAEIFAARNDAYQGDTFVSRWQQRYEQMAATIDSRLTMQMVQVRAEAAIDHVAGQRVLSAPGVAAADVDAAAGAVKAELRIAMQDQVTGVQKLLPASMGQSEVRSMLAGIRHEVDKAVGARLAAATPETREMGAALRADAYQVLQQHPVPVALDAGYEAETAVIAARLQSVYDDVRAAPNRWDPDGYLLDEGFEVARGRLLDDFDARYESRWNFDRAAWEEHFTKALAELPATVNAYVLREQVRLNVDERITRDLVTAYEKLPLTDASRARVQAAGGAFRRAVEQEFERAFQADDLAYRDVQQWGVRYAAMTDRLDSWLTVRMVADRFAADPGVPAVGVESAVADYLKLSGVSPLPPSVGVESQVRLAEQIAAELDGRWGQAVESVRDEPVPVPAGGSYRDELSRLTFRIDDTVGYLDDEPDPVVAAAMQEFRDHLVRDFETRYAHRWDFDRRAWEEQFAQSLAGADAWIGAGAQVGREVAALVERSLAAVPASVASAAAGEAFGRAVVGRFAGKYPPGTEFTPAREQAWQEEVAGYLPVADSWMTVHQIGTRLIDRFGREAEIREVLASYLDLGRRVLPASIGADEQGRLADEVGIRLGAGEAMRQELVDRPVPVSDSAGFVGLRADAAAEVDRVVADVVARRGPDGDLDAYAGFREYVLGDLDSRYASKWNFDRRAWREHFEATTARADQWLEHHQSRRTAFADVSAMLDKRLEGAEPVAAEVVRREVEAGFARWNPAGASFDHRHHTVWLTKLNSRLAFLDDWLKTYAVREPAMDLVEETVADLLRVWQQQHHVAEWEVDELRAVGKTLTEAIDDVTAPPLSRTITPSQIAARLETLLAERSGGRLSPAVRVVESTLQRQLLDHIRSASADLAPVTVEPLAVPVERSAEVRAKIAELRPDFDTHFTSPELSQVEWATQLSALFRHRAEQEFSRTVGRIGILGRAMDQQAATFRDWYDELRTEFRWRVVYQRQIDQVLSERDSVAAARERWAAEDQAVVAPILALFSRQQQAIVHQSWDAVYRWHTGPGRAVPAAVDMLRRMNDQLVAGLDERLATAKKRAEALASIDEKSTAAVESFDRTTGRQLTPWYRQEVQHAYRQRLGPTPGIGTDNALSRSRDAEAALEHHLALAGLMSEFENSLDGLPRHVTRDVTEAARATYRTLLAMPASADPKPLDLLTRSLEAIKAELPARQAFETELIGKLDAVSAATSATSLMKSGIPDDAAAFVERFVNDRVTAVLPEAFSRIGDEAAGFRYAPDQIAPIAEAFASDLDGVVSRWVRPGGLSGGSSPVEPDEVILDPVLRALATTETGQQYIKATDPAERDTAILRFGETAGLHVVEGMPELLELLPDADVHVVAVAGIVAEVRKYVGGDKNGDALDAAMALAEVVRVSTRYALMEYVMSYGSTDAGLQRLRNRIMDC